jgi:hypothetical protein
MIFDPLGGDGIAVAVEFHRYRAGTFEMRLQVKRLYNIGRRVEGI